MSHQTGIDYGELLAVLDPPPVLIDVGASGDTPAIWDNIAASSIYVGFDPDLREMKEQSGTAFRRFIVVNEAVTDRIGAPALKFYLTRSPYCSSTLLPDTAALEQFVFSDLFVVESEIEVKATTLDKVVERIGLPRIDWLKLDTQGTDLRLFTSLTDRLRSGVLAIDVEPGLINAYEGEDLFVDTHKALMQAGFWLSALDVKGAVRIRKTTIDALQESGSKIDRDAIQQSIRATPGWCEARYLRTLESLAATRADEREYVLLWIFAMSDGQIGFALDVAYEAKRRFPLSSTIGRLVADTRDRLETPAIIAAHEAISEGSDLTPPRAPTVFQQLRMWATGR